MISTRRGFLSTLTGLATTSPWRIGWSSPPPPPSAHDTLPSAATVSILACRNTGFPSTVTRTPEESVTISANHAPSRKQPPPELRSIPPWLDRWLRLPRLPLMRNHLLQLGMAHNAECFTAALLAERIRTGKPAAFTYNGGSSPGETRTVIPVFLFSVPENVDHPDLTREPVYLLAHCLTRHATRTFRLDRISLA